MHLLPRWAAGCGFLTRWLRAYLCRIAYIPRPLPVRASIATYPTRALPANYRPAHHWPPAGPVQMVFSSSCTVYGMPDVVPITEEAPLKAISPYGRTKLFQVGRGCPAGTLTTCQYTNKRWP